jgi:hypothetical protein
VTAAVAVAVAAAALAGAIAVVCAFILRKVRAHQRLLEREIESGK